MREFLNSEAGTFYIPFRISDFIVNRLRLHHRRQMPSYRHMFIISRTPAVLEKLVRDSPPFDTALRIQGDSPCRQNGLPTSGGSSPPFSHGSRFMF